MRSFRDNKGRVWRVEINVWQVSVVKQTLGLSLYLAFTDGYRVYNEIVSDPCTLVNVLYTLCQDQAEKAGVSQEDFGRAMAGSAIQEAQRAFSEELVDFFPDAATRDAARHILKTAREVQAALAQKGLQSAKQLTPKKIIAALSESYTKPPESLESTPAA